MFTSCYSSRSHKKEIGSLIILSRNPSSSIPSSFLIFFQIKGYPNSWFLNTQSLIYHLLQSCRDCDIFPGFQHIKCLLPNERFFLSYIVRSFHVAFVNRIIDFHLLQEEIRLCHVIEDKFLIYLQAFNESHKRYHTILYCYVTEVKDILFPVIVKINIWSKIRHLLRISEDGFRDSIIMDTISFLWLLLFWSVRW